MAKSLLQANAAALHSLGVNKSEFKTSLSVVEEVVGDFIRRVLKNIQSIPDFVTIGSIERLSLENVGDFVYGSEYLLYQHKDVNGSKLKLYDTPYIRFKASRGGCFVSLYPKQE